MKLIITGLSLFFIYENVLGDNFYEKGLMKEYTLNSDSEVFEVKIEDKKEPPNPTITLGISIFPGILIHGSGHFYICEPLTGFILLGIEVVGIPLSLLAAVSCDGTQESECIFGTLGVFMLWGSWLYDVIAAPIKASKMRKEYELKKKEKQLAPGLGFLPAKDFRDASLSLTWRF